MRLLESHEANVPGRVGLATAVREYLDTGPQQVWPRLAEVGALTREALDGLPGWAVLSPGGGSSAITALRATAGQDIGDTRARLLAGHGIVTTAADPGPGPAGDDRAAAADQPARGLRSRATSACSATRCWPCADRRSAPPPG